MKKKFTKADLKNGDVVKVRDGDVGFAIVDLGVITFGRQIENLDKFYNDLTHRTSETCDVIAVRRPIKPEDCRTNAFEHNIGFLVYERKEIEEMTLEEVCKALGKEIKIVKEK